MVRVGLLLLRRRLEKVVVVVVVVVVVATIDAVTESAPRSIHLPVPQAAQAVHPRRLGPIVPLVPLTWPPVPTINHKRRPCPVHRLSNPTLRPRRKCWSVENPAFPVKGMSTTLLHCMWTREVPLLHLRLLRRPVLLVALPQQKRCFFDNGQPAMICCVLYKAW